MCIPFASLGSGGIISNQSRSCLFAPRFRSRHLRCCPLTRWFCTAGLRRSLLNFNQTVWIASSVARPSRIANARIGCAASSRGDKMK
jgi:hypothetical protein